MAVCRSVNSNFHVIAFLDLNQLFLGIILLIRRILLSWHYHFLITKNTFNVFDFVTAANNMYMFEGNKHLFINVMKCKFEIHFKIKML